MLTNKSLEYSPEITLEIFTLVWNKLVENGWSHYSGESISECYITFSTKDHYFEESSRCMKFKCYHNPSDPSTSVQEILGYDPFMKENYIAGIDPFVEDDFVLPDKWCIKRNRQEINDWLNKNKQSNTTYSIIDSNFVHYPTYDGVNHLLLYIQNGYTEITFDQFKKYVLKESIEEPKVKSKEVIPEYVECIEESYGLTKGSIYEVDEKGFILGGIGSTYFSTYCVKPSTKEAFDAQNQPKSIEKWSAGSYVVFLENVSAKAEIGMIDEITQSLDSDECVSCKNYLSLAAISRENHNEIKWFATKSEAEEFAKTLVEPVKKEVKQPLKQAVHCTTQEEWDFVLSKFNPRKLESNHFDRHKSNSIIIFSKEQNKSYYGAYSNKNETAFKEIIDFQEWCDLNGHTYEYHIKMEKEVKFEVGKWYQYNPSVYLKFKCLDGTYFICSERIVDGKHSIKTDKYRSNPIMECSIEEIQQYLPDGHIDKYKFKVGDRVEIISAGSGCHDRCKGEQVTILALGKYCSKPGYKTSPTIGESNANTGQYDYMIGEDSFKLVSSDPSKSQVGDWVTITKSTKNWNDLMDSYVGKTVQIKSINSINYIKFNGDGNWGWGYYDAHFRHATPTEISGQKLLEVKTDTSIDLPPMIAHPYPKKTILSIDDDELPMIRIKKQKTITQLLDN